MKKCPYCAEEIQDEAILCRYCRSDLRAPAVQLPPAPGPWTSPAIPAPAPAPERKYKVTSSALALIAASGFCSTAGLGYLGNPNITMEVALIAGLIGALALWVLGLIIREIRGKE